MKASIYPAHPVLIVDDEAPMVSGYRMALTRSGITHLLCHTDSRTALKAIQTQTIDLLILDLNMPFVTGTEILRAAAEHQPDVPVLVITGEDSIESAVACTRQGAYDYLVKPISAERMITAVRNALKVRELQQENQLLGTQFFARNLKHPEHFSELITADPVMRSTFIYIEAIAPTGHPVLLTGETGVGKELVARAIHRASGRKGRFVAVNIAGLDDTLFSDALFGHARGAFTGADTPRQGLIQQATGGTLFLDEIGDLPAASQVKLLRLLQEQEYTPLGQDTPVQTDARIVVATNADLTTLQESRKFRPDLYYRLRTHKIHIPPLRQRRGDLGSLLDHFVETAARRQNKKKPTVPGELLALLSTYEFPGNVRELEAMVTDALSRHTSRMLSLKAFRECIGAKTGAIPAPPMEPSAAASPRPDTCFGETLPHLKDIKNLLVQEALRRTNGNRTRAARLLGTTRQALTWYLQNCPDL